MRHGETTPVPAEALLAPDFELHLVNAPLHEPGTSCSNGACHDEESCTCDEAGDNE